MKKKIENFLVQNGVKFPCQAVLWMPEGNYLVNIFTKKSFIKVVENFDEINLNDDDEDENGGWEKLLEIVEFLEDESDSKYLFIESNFRIEINGKKLDPSIEVSSSSSSSSLEEIAITGTFSVKRDDLAEKLLSLGFKLVKNPTKKTKIMLVGEITASKEKKEKAEKLGMKIISGFDTDLVLSQLTAPAINFKEYDFVQFKKGGVCDFCEKEGDVYGYPSESPAEAYCPACAGKKIDSDLRVVRVDKNTLFKIFEEYDRDEVYDEDLGEALVSGNFLERFKFDPELFLHHFTEIRKESFYFEFHRTPEGRCIRIMSDGNVEVCIYPLP